MTPEHDDFPAHAPGSLSDPALDHELYRVIARNLKELTAVVDKKLLVAVERLSTGVSEMHKEVAGLHKEANLTRGELVKLQRGQETASTQMIAFAARVDKLEKNDERRFEQLTAIQANQTAAGNASALLESRVGRLEHVTSEIQRLTGMEMVATRASRFRVPVIVIACLASIVTTLAAMRLLSI